jgi:RsmE family RNA methyltransferase
MNLLLFTPGELGSPLNPADPRAIHLRKVLRRRVGDEFDLGVLDGPRGKGRVLALPGDGSVEFAATLGQTPPPLAPLQLVVGLPRPQTARKILQELTAIGVSGIQFVMAERTEPSYAQSTLWSSGEWRDHLLEGAQQAFCTRLPAVSSGRSLAAALSDISKDTLRLALDNYEAEAGLADCDLPVNPADAVLAVGPERGWGPGDRAALRAAGFRLVHLGQRVLRVETAAVAASAVLKSRLGWLGRP